MMIFNYDIFGTMRMFNAYHNNNGNVLKASNAIINDIFLQNIINEKNVLISDNANAEGATNWVEKTKNENGDEVYDSVAIIRFEDTLDSKGVKTFGNITHVYIQKKVDDEDWKTYYKIKLDDNNDKNVIVKDNKHDVNGFLQGSNSITGSGKTITVIDKYVSSKVSGANVSYRAVPVVLNSGDENLGTPSSSSTVEVISSNNIIYDADTQYELIYNFSVGDIKRNKPTTYVETLGSQYPIVMTSGKVNYDTGSVSCMIVADTTTDNNVNLQDQHNLIKEIKEWLSNGEAKILKLMDGTFKLIQVDNGITIQPNCNVGGLFDLSFSYTEIGDPTNPDDLEKFGLVTNGN